MNGLKLHDRCLEQSFRPSGSRETQMRSVKPLRYNDKNKQQSNCLMDSLFSEMQFKQIGSSLLFCSFFIIGCQAIKTYFQHISYILHFSLDVSRYYVCDMSEFKTKFQFEIYLHSS